MFGERRWREFRERSAKIAAERAREAEWEPPNDPSDDEHGTFRRQGA